MARLNGLVTSSRRGIYWQLIDVGGPDVLTIAVSNQTPGSLKDLLRRATVPGFWPPEGNEYGLWYRPGCDERTREHSVVLLQRLSALGRRQGPRAAVSRGGSSSVRHNPGNAGVGPPHPQSCISIQPQIIPTASSADRAGPGPSGRGITWFYSGSSPLAKSSKSYKSSSFGGYADPFYGHMMQPLHKR